MYSTIDMIKTGENINQKISEQNYSVKEISDCLGFNSTRSVYKWIKGINLPTLDNLLILSEILGTTMDELIIRG